MKKQTLIILIWFFTVIPSLAQDSIRIVILSPKVGEIIDKIEINRFRILNQYKNLEKAIFYRTADDKYYGNFSILQPDGTEKDTFIQYSEISLLNLSEKIENWEKIIDGSYIWGENPPKLTFKDGGFITKEDIIFKQRKVIGSLYETKSLKNFHFLRQNDFIEIETYPKFSAGVGLGFNDLKFNNLKDAFYLFERRLDEEGYSFTHQYKDNLSVNPLINLFFRVSIIKYLDILFEISNSLSGSVFRSAFISFFYNCQIFNSTPFFVFAGAGLGSYYFKVEKEYNIHLKNGGTLETINAEGKKFATTLSAGIKYEFTKSSDIGLFSNYSFVPKMVTTIKGTDYKASVELKGFSGSVKFSIGF